MSHKKERQITLLSVQMPYRDVERVYRELTGHSSGRMSAHRVTQHLAQKLPSKPYPLIRSVSQPPEGKYHYSADGTMIHIRREGWKEAKVGACYEVDQDGKGRNTRYVATLQDREALGQKLYALAGSPSLEETEGTAFISDGAEWLTDLRQEHFPLATPIVDFYHASEYIWKTARGFYGEGSEKARAWAEPRVKQLRKGQQEKLRQSFCHLRPKTQDQQEILTNARRYFRNHGHKMNYPKYKSLGYHIGSGVIEGACKNVIQSRMKRSGMRWSRLGAENLLKLRGTHLNNDWNQIALCQKN